jgi:hypothetical protein
VSRFSLLAFGHLNFEHDDAREKIVIFMWLYMLDRLASDPSHVPFPLVAKLLFRDEQWLPDGQQWEDLSPPWDLPCCVLTEKNATTLAEIKDCASQVEIFLNSWFVEESEDKYSDFLTFLMGWMLCPHTRGWSSHNEWVGPPCKNSEEACTCRFWKVLVHWQNVIRVRHPFFQLQSYRCSRNFEMGMLSLGCRHWFVCSRCKSNLA